LPPELPEQVILHDPEAAWHAWGLMEMTDWRFLPRAGGLLDQPEALLEDILTLASLNQMVERILENSAQPDT
jgi:hypothetical protein